MVTGLTIETKALTLTLTPNNAKKLVKLEQRWKTTENESCRNVHILLLCGYRFVYFGMLH